MYATFGSVVTSVLMCLLSFVVFLFCSEIGLRIHSFPLLSLPLIFYFISCISLVSACSSFHRVIVSYRYDIPLLCLL